MKTTEVDLDKVAAYLKNQVGWVALDKIRKAIPSKHADVRKIEAMRHIGLLERDGENVKLSADGREYAAGDETKRAEVIRRRLRADPLYNATLEWMHFNSKTEVNKTDVANYWHDNHQAEIGGAEGDALTDPAVFFMRMAGLGGVGKFVPAGVGRETHLRVDEAELEAFATGERASGEGATKSGDVDEGKAQPMPTIPTPALPPTPAQSALTMAAGLNVNLEIHIAADAKAATIEEIFKNMRKYLLEGASTSADGA
jgi:hypothetical protein